MIILSDDAECSRFPIVNNSLIVANIAVAIWMLFSLDSLNQFYVEHGLVPGRFLSVHDTAQFGTIMTAMFIHAGFFHILGNMWVLWLFGDNVEDKLGHFNYLCFYITCGILAACAHMLSDPSSALPCVGASGAIAGVMAAYMVLFPGAKCKSWFGDDSFWFSFRTFQVPAVVVIGGWFLLQALATQIHVIEFNVAIYAHIGGFTAGLFLVLLLNRMADKHDDCADQELARLSPQERMVRTHSLLPQSELQYRPSTIIFASIAFVSMLAIVSGLYSPGTTARPVEQVSTPSLAVKPPATKQKHRVHSVKPGHRLPPSAATSKQHSQ